MNPYRDATFFEFFGTLFSRMGDFVCGREGVLQSDELQILTLLLMAISCGLVGTFLWLKKMTMLANAISHTILVGIASIFLVEHFWGGADVHFEAALPHEGYVIAASLGAAFLTVIGAQFFALKIRIKEDVAVGIVFTFLFALGVILVTLFSKNAHIGSELLMGNADALVQADLLLQFKLALFNIAAILLFYRAMIAACFDPLFAGLIGFRPHAMSYFLMALVAITSVVSFRAVGVMLVLVFFVLPPLLARCFTCRIKYLLMIAVTVSSSFVVIGVALSRHLFSVYAVPVSTSALIASFMCLAYLLVLLIRRPA